MDTARRIPIVGVVTAMWKRHELTDIVFGNLAALRDALRDVIGLCLVVAGSEGDASRNLSEKHGFTYVEVPNSPLGAKWNAALRLLQGQDIDGVCIVGSDDLLNEAYFRMVADSVQQGEKLFGIDSFYIFDRFSGRMFHWMGYSPPRDKEAIGLGRFIHKDYINALCWTLWDDNFEQGLDRSMRERIEALGAATGMESQFVFKPILDYDIVPVDIKHEQQMWTYEITALFCHHIKILGNPQAFLEKYYSDAVLDFIFAPCRAIMQPVQEDYYLPPWENKITHTPRYETPIISLLAQNIAKGDKTNIFVPFSHRYNITYIPPAQTSEKDIVGIIHTFSTMHTRQDIQLSIFTSLLGNKGLPEHGINSYGMGNIHTWRNLFRVYIVADDFNTVSVVKDLLEHGCVVICYTGMERYYPKIKDTKAVLVNTLEEALLMAQLLHDRMIF